MRYVWAAKKEDRQFIKVKSSSIKQTGKTEDIGKWEIPLTTILDGKYYVKLTIGQEFHFTQDSDINKRGNSDPISVVYGERYEVKVGIALEEFVSGEPQPWVTKGIRINVGGPDFMDKQGNIWAGYETATIYSSAIAYSLADMSVINGTDMLDLYRSELYFARTNKDDPPMQFEVPVPCGTYIARLHFVELWRKAQSEGSCIFNMLIEGKLVWKNLDIFKEAGGGYTPVVKESRVTVIGSNLGDPLLTLKFENVTENPALSAIEILTEPSCINMTVDFDNAADGTPLAAGLYVADEWLGFGLHLLAPKQVKGLLCLLDTGNPAPEPGCTGPNLGAPNRACTPPGPGVGPGGAPGKPGENCEELGNVLIIQGRCNSPIPDDGSKGGTIIFTFVHPAALVYSMGFLDTDDGIVVKVSHTTEEGTVETKFDLPVYGDNSKQTLEINIKNVKQVTVTFAQSGAVTHINFCRRDVNDGISNKPAQHVAQERSFGVL